MIDKQLEQTLSINDTILIQRFKKFKDTPANFNSKNNNHNDDDDDNNKPPSNPFDPASPQPNFIDFPDYFQQPSKPFTQQPSSSVFQPPRFQQSKNAFDRFSTTPTGPGEQLMSEIERVVEKAKHKEEVEQIIPSDPLLEYFQKADEILKTDFVLQKDREKAVLEDFRKEYQIDTLTDQIDQGQIPEILEFYLVEKIIFFYRE